MASSGESRKLIPTFAVVTVVGLGVLVSSIGLFMSSTRGPSNGVGRAPDMPLSGEQVDIRLESCTNVLRNRFDSAVANGELSRLQADRLADRAASCVVELMTGDAESYSELMISWGGVPKDVPWSRPEKLNEFLRRDQSLYPFYEYDLTHATVRSPNVRPDGLTIVRMDSAKVHSEQDSAWEFPDVGPVSNPSTELRIITVAVTSRNGNEGELDYWWQWDEREKQWIPRMIRYITSKKNFVPAMVF